MGQLPLLAKDLIQSHSERYFINTVRTYKEVTYQYSPNAEGPCQFCQNLYTGINTVWRRQMYMFSSFSSGRSTAATNVTALNKAAAAPAQVSGEMFTGLVQTFSRPGLMRSGHLDLTEIRSALLCE